MQKQHYINFLIHRKFSVLTHFSLRGDILSPIKHLYLKEHLSKEKERDILTQVSDKVSIIQYLMKLH